MFTIAPPLQSVYTLPMSDPQPVDDPKRAMGRMQDAMRQILTVSKPEILKREREAKEQRKREDGAQNTR